MNHYLNLSKLRTDSTIVVTPTGGRPKALSFLNGYLERQTDQDFFWIVLDDCVPRTPKPERCDYMYSPPWVWSEGMVTQNINMISVLNFCLPSHKVIVCEDDDWYGKEYISWMKEKFGFADLVGDKNPFYYNLNDRSYHRRRQHAPLCATGFTGDALEHFKNICEKYTSLLDTRMWRWNGKKILFHSDPMLCVGIKGGEGRSGITNHGKKGTADPGMEFLESIIGEDIKNYRN